MIRLDLQNTLPVSDNLPTEEQLRKWLSAVAKQQMIEDTDITIRLVDDEESQFLNSTYRNKDKPTNVLSFPFEAPPGVELPFLGDLVICSSVVAMEAKQQNKEEQHHWAHMVIHGCLHLLGYDHINDNEAEEMETTEVTILRSIGIDDPYQDHYS